MGAQERKNQLNADVASATTLVLSGKKFVSHITGTTTVTGISATDAEGETVGPGQTRTLILDGACPLTHNGTSFQLIGGASRVSVAGDVSTFLHLGSGNWKELCRNKAGENSDKGHISGLSFSWIDADNISISSGACYIEGAGAVVEKSTATTLTPTVSADLQYHVYAYDNSGTLAFEAATTAPATAYFGSAQSKTGDTSRRYIGSFLTKSAGDIIRFYFVGSGQSCKYAVHSAGTDTRIVNTSTTSATEFDCSGLVPPSVKMGLFRLLFNGGATTQAGLGAASGHGYTYAAGNGADFVYTITPCPFTATRTIWHQIFNGAGTIIVDLAGYEFDR